MPIFANKDFNGVDMKLTSETIKKLSKEQLELLIELGDLAKKEAELTEKIENTRRQAEKAGLGRDREEVKNLMDDPEFDDLLSVRVINEREQIREKIKSILISLVNAGLDKLDIVNRQVANYGISLKEK
jgi:seryl-tRNA synthetase